jgi:hypothetical protein
MKWFVRKHIYVPTWPVFLGGCLLVGVLAVALVSSVYDWLAVDRLVELEAAPDQCLLVVEGWAPDDVVAEAAALFQRGGYARIASTGGPITGMVHLFQTDTYASFGAGRLIGLGIPAESIIVASAVSVDRRRTQRSALDLKEELKRHEGIPPVINILTHCVHARRSRMIFQRVFGDEAVVGVRGIASEDFTAKTWWKSSAGLKSVPLEIVSLIYDWAAPARH